MKNWREGLSVPQYILWTALQLAALGSAYALLLLPQSPTRTDLLPLLALAPLASLLRSRSDERYTIFFWTFGLAAALGFVALGMTVFELIRSADRTHISIGPIAALGGLCVIYLLLARLSYTRSHLAD